MLRNLCRSNPEKFEGSVLSFMAKSDGYFCVLGTEYTLNIKSQQKAFHTLVLRYSQVSSWFCNVLPTPKNRCECVHMMSYNVLMCNSGCIPDSCLVFTSQTLDLSATLTWINVLLKKNKWELYCQKTNYYVYCINNIWTIHIREWENK